MEAMNEGSSKYGGDDSIPCLHLKYRCKYKHQNTNAETQIPKYKYKYVTIEGGGNGGGDDGLPCLHQEDCWGTRRGG